MDINNKLKIAEILIHNTIILVVVALFGFSWHELKGELKEQAQRFDAGMIATNQRFDAYNQRLDDLYRELISLRKDMK